jgi:hypothetical protein
MGDAHGLAPDRPHPDMSYADLPASMGVRCADFEGYRSAEVRLRFSHDYGAGRAEALACRWSQREGAAEMIVDVRTYTLIPRKQAKYLELFENHALPVTKRHGLELMSYYVSYIGALNQVVHLWRYDSLADMEKKRAARDADPAWGEFLSLTEGMLLLQEDKVMRPTSFSPIR